MKVLLTGGAGDVIALLSLMTADERDSLDTIYWACSAASFTRPLFESCPTFAHVRHVVLPLTQPVYYSLEHARQDHVIPDDVADWSIVKRFPEASSRPFRRSSFFVPDPMKVTRNLDLPREYLVCQHETPANSPHQRALRDLDPRDWDAILSRLEATQANLVVLNSREASDPPRHLRVRSLVGRTNFIQSIAVLQGAVGYWGIASSLCVLASQIFDADRLWCKGPESWLKLNRSIYFAPHKSFPFLFDHLADTQPWRGLNVGTRRLRLASGETIEASPIQVECLMRSGLGKEICGSI